MESILGELNEDEAGQEIYRECELDARYRNPKQSLKERFRNGLRSHCGCSVKRFKRLIISVFPVINWLPKYDMKDNFIADMAAGLTVGVVHIPQGLAYALLANLPPIVGLYVSLFPVLLYPIFGTSRHVSMGTFAILSILISGILDQRVPDTYCGEDSSTILAASTPSSIQQNSSDNSSAASSNMLLCQQLNERRKIEVAIALSICVGLIQILMSVCRLGTITVFLSQSLLSGFLCGASFLVITSQVSKLFGIEVERYSPPFALIYTYIAIFRNITEVNWATFVLSTCCMILLILGKELNQRFKKKLRVPIPWEIVIVIVTTALSYFLHLETDYQVDTVGEIKKGISTTLPKGNDVAGLFFDAIPLAVVAFTVEISLCQIFAVKHSYEIDSNQELLALGACNIFGAFFSCFPSASSLSRSVIYEEVGGKTQIGAFFSSVVVLVVLLWIGPLFRPLPQAALAVIIIVNIKNVALLLRNVKPLWRISRLDAVTWIIAWLSVLLFGVSMGLLIGAMFSIFTVLLRTRNVTGVALQKVARGGVYRDSRKYSTVSTHEEIFVYQFTGPLFFANQDKFTKQLAFHLGFDPVEESARKKAVELEAKGDKSSADKEEASTSPFNKANRETNGNAKIVSEEPPSLRTGEENSSISSEISSIRGKSGYSYVIFDMSRCSFVDSDGAKVIRKLYDAFHSLGVSLMLASCSDGVKRSLGGSWKDRDPAMYVSLEGAVKFAKNRRPVQQANGSNGKALSKDNGSAV